MITGRVDNGFGQKSLHFQPQLPTGIPLASPNLFPHPHKEDANSFKDWCKDEIGLSVKHGILQ